MKTIALLIPYYGRYPNYFPLWLETVSFNSTIDFYIITDINTELRFPSNVYEIKMSFDVLKNKIQNMFDFHICLEKPYKLCDYRPLYGLIFEDIIKQYDFWGYCDTDIIWGDIRHFITEEVLNDYDKIYTRGHLSLYRNTPLMNQLCLQDHRFLVNTYKDALTTDYSCHFDEWGGISKIVQLNGINYYDNIDFADIQFNIFQFEFAKPLNRDNHPKAFLWRDGKLFGYTYHNHNITNIEYAYIHLQKRTMEFEFKDVPESFAIIPNQFIKYSKDDISERFIEDNCKKKLIYTDYIKMRVKMIFENVKAGALQQRYLIYKKRRLIKKNRY